MNDSIANDVRDVMAALYGGIKSPLIEYRVCGVPKKGIMSGYFDDLEKLARIADRHDGKGNSYIVLNPVDPEVKARSYNKLRPYAKVTTSDKEIPHRFYILIDFDPARPSDISSTDEEHKMARRLAKQVWGVLQSDFGFPDMFRADSGNGAHILVPCDFPNSPEITDLVRNFLLAIQSLFQTDEVKIDTAVYNAARLIRLYGTLNMKGDDLSERPHRYSRLLHVPEKRIPVSREAMEKVIAEIGIGKAVNRSPRAGDNGRFDLKAFIDRHGISVSEVEETGEGIKYHLAECPFNPEHKGKDSGLIQFNNGAVGFHCFHDSCSDKNWQDVRMLYEGVDAELESQCAACEKSDMGNGYRLILRHGHMLRYVAATDTWYIWDGRYWKPDVVKEALDIAGKTAELIKDTEAATIPPDENEEGELDWSQRDAHIGFGIRSEDVGKRECMLKSARSDERIRCKPQDWDRNPWLLTVANGTIELGNGALLRPHDPQDMITKLIDIPYDPEAECPLWLSYLKRVLPDKAERRFLRKYVGYCLTGITSAHCFLFLYGLGHNGKTVFMKMVQALLSSYHFHADRNVVTETKSQRDNYALAELVGMRLVTIGEAGGEDVLDEATIKNMTGNGKIACRPSYGRPYSYEPEFKIIWCGNHKPRIVGTDTGIWRRPKILHFSQTIPESERDPELPDKLLEELPGILAWAVRGCLAWQEEGLREPESMKLALLEYRSEMDTFQQFVDEHLTITGDDADTVPAQYLYDQYKYWCDRTGHEADSITKFARRMRDKGFKKAHTKSGNVWISVEIKPLEDTDGVLSGLKR